jgi:tight adherence protein C
MEMSTLIGYAAVALTVAGLSAFVFLLFPGRKPVAEEVPTGAGGVIVQQPSVGRSIVSAAPAGYAGWIERQLILGGRPIGWTVGRVLGWKVGLGLVGLVFGILFVLGDPHPIRIALALAGTILLFFLPDVRINSRAHDRQQRIGRSLPDTLDQMTIAVEAGLGFDGAMAKAARGGQGPLAEELIRVLQDMSLGRTRRDSFHELEMRTNVEELRRFVRAVIQADAYGVAIGDVLRVQAGEMRLKRRQRAEEQAQKIAVKILFPLIFCLLPVLFIVILTPTVWKMIETLSGR